MLLTMMVLIKNKNEIIENESVHKTKAKLYYIYIIFYIDYIIYIQYIYILYHICFKNVLYYTQRLVSGAARPPSRTPLRTPLLTPLRKRHRALCGAASESRATASGRCSLREGVRKHKIVETKQKQKQIIGNETIHKTKTKTHIFLICRYHPSLRCLSLGLPDSRISGAGGRWKHFCCNIRFFFNIMLRVSFPPGYDGACRHCWISSSWIPSGKRLL